MKKMILISVIVLVVLLIGIGFYNASKLQHIHLKNTVQIEANIQDVFDNVAYLNRFTKWSPFYEADPEQITQVKGNDGQVGAQFHWNGNKGKDLGHQEIKQLENRSYIKMECDIQKPFKANPIFEYSFQQNGKSVTVVQDFHLNSGLIDAFFMGIFGAKKDMNKMNARGLELLKNLCEKE